MNRREHWNVVYRSKPDHQLSWTQPEPALSLALIQEVCPRGSVIDIGGGASRLALRLIEKGYSATVLDISEAALDRARADAGERAGLIRWIAADVTGNPALGTFDIWHDRAVFHFLTEPAERAAYVELLARTIPAGGHAVIATFSLEGPEKCSGLPVRRYSDVTLAAELGPAFRLLKSIPEIHSTPWGAKQAFQYCAFIKGESIPNP